MMTEFTFSARKDRIRTANLPLDPRPRISLHKFHRFPLSRHLDSVQAISNTEMKIASRFRSSRALAFLFAAVMLAASAPLPGQMGPSPTAAAQPARSSQAIQLPANPGANLEPQSPILGSVPEGEVTSQEVPLSITDAINRGLKHNLGLLLNETGAQSARAQRLRALSDLLPNVNGAVRESVQRVNLKAFGFPLPPGTPSLVGPFGNFDLRASGSQSIFDLTAVNRVRSANSEVKAAELNYRSARELVVLAVGSIYLQAVADLSRVEAAQAQLQTAQALFQQATDLQKAGVTARIDPLRSQVELEARQQELIVAQNDLDKNKLSLARVIGLPIAQPFKLTDRIPFAPLAELDLEGALQRAYTRRPDYLGAQAQVEAAERSKQAAELEYLPSVGVSGDFGALGLTPGDARNTYSVAGMLRVPIFQGGKIRADVQQADATLRERKAELADLRGRIEYEVRSAFLDVQAAAKQVEVAQTNLNLANETLAESKDRFSAGVADNLEVVQAQQSVAAANDNYIGSLYQHNVAKVTLAKALGIAEEAVRNYLGGSK